MKEKLLAAVVLLSLLTPMLPVSAAVLPGQEESGEGFWAMQEFATPTSYPTYSTVKNVQKISAKNGIFIKDGFTTETPNTYFSTKSFNSQYIVEVGGDHYQMKVNLRTLTGEVVDVPDQYENSGCIAVGRKNEIDAQRTKFIGCKTGAINEIVVGKIANGQVKIQKRFNIEKSGTMYFKQEDFQGYNNIEGKHLAFNINSAGYVVSIHTLNIETGETKNVTKQIEKGGFKTSFSQIVGWKGNDLIVAGYNQGVQTIYRYNVASNTVAKVGNVYTPTSTCQQDLGHNFIMNQHSSTDMGLYMVIYCTADNAAYSYILSKMNLNSGKMTEIKDSKSLATPNVSFGKMQFSTKGNYLGINTHSNSGSDDFIYRYDLSTNTMTMIKANAELI
jgi:hypothetical protein